MMLAIVIGLQAATELAGVTQRGSKGLWPLNKCPHLAEFLKPPY